MNSPAITFRPLVEADLPMLHGWLNEPGVVRWWEGDDVSWAGVVKDYGPGGDEDCHHHIVVENGREVGWIQACDVEEDEDAAPWFAAGIPRTTAGIDYLIGEPARRGSGLGTRMITAFLEQVVFADDSEFTGACADPVVANEASWKALRAAGFRHVADHVDPKFGPCRLMYLPRS